MAQSPQRREAQCSCIGCIGLRTALHTGRPNNAAGRSAAHWLHMSDLDQRQSYRTFK